MHIPYNQMHIPYNLLEIPPFSLGLSQETAPDAPDELANANPINYVLPTKHAEHYVSETHKSKRLSKMPSGLNDFRCDPKIAVGLSHSRSRSSFSSVGRTPPKRSRLEILFIV